MVCVALAVDAICHLNLGLGLVRPIQNKDYIIYQIKKRRERAATIPYHSPKGLLGTPVQFLINAIT